MKAKSIGYTTGVYDLFHIGHLNLLKRAKAQCEKLIVGVTTDELAIERKGRGPVIPYSERVDIVSSIRYVDLAVPQRHMNKFEAWEALQFDVMFVGDDWKGTEEWLNYEKQFSKVNVEIVYLPYTVHTNSTELKSALEHLG